MLKPEFRVVERIEQSRQAFGKFQRRVGDKEAKTAIVTDLAMAVIAGVMHEIRSAVGVPVIDDVATQNQHDFLPHVPVPRNADSGFQPDQLAFGLRVHVQ